MTQDFGNLLSSEELARGITGNVLMYKTSGGKTEVAVLYVRDNSKNSNNLGNIDDQGYFCL